MSELSLLRTVIYPKSTLANRIGIVLSGTLFLALLAQISFPLPGSPVPLTGQTLGVLLLSAPLGAELALTTFAFYLLLGVAGAPFFAGGTHGIARLTGATGGYLVGMLLASLVMGALSKRGLDRKIITSLPVMLIGEACIFSLGLIWLHHVTALPWSKTFAIGFTPFLLGEALKMAVAGSTMPLLWKFVASRK